VWFMDCMVRISVRIVSLCVGSAGESVEPLVSVGLGPIGLYLTSWDWEHVASTGSINILSIIITLYTANQKNLE